MTEELKGKTILVTGASAGIGAAAARALAGMGARVGMVARDRARGEAAVAEVRAVNNAAQVDLFLADMSETDSIRHLAAEVKAKYPRLDVLINNAGGVFGDRRVNSAGVEYTWALNHLGYFMLTDLLLDLLKASAPARIVSVSSAAHVGGHIDFDDLGFTKRRYSLMSAYSQSKLANVLFAYELARRLEGTGVTSNALHPGMVSTRFAKDGDVGGLMAIVGKVFGSLGLKPEQGADTVVYLASSPEVAGATGKYFIKRKAVNSSQESYDAGVAKRLWQLSADAMR